MMLSVQDQTSIVSKHNTEIEIHFVKKIAIRTLTWDHMVISIWFFQVCLFRPFWLIDKLAKSEVKNPYKPIFNKLFFISVEISISCIMINFILLPMMLIEGGEENSICHISAARFNK